MIKKPLRDKNHYFIVIVMPRQPDTEDEILGDAVIRPRFSSTVHLREYQELDASKTGVDVTVYHSPGAATADGKGDPGVSNQAGGPDASKYQIFIRDLNSGIDGDEALLREWVKKLVASEFPKHLYYQLCCADVT